MKQNKLATLNQASIKEEYASQEDNTLNPLDPRLRIMETYMYRDTVYMEMQF